MAVSSFDIPGDGGFPLNSFLAKPTNRGESGEWKNLANNTPLHDWVVILLLPLPNTTPSTTRLSPVSDQMRQYFTQLRQEMGLRLVDKVFGSEEKPSKVGFFFPC